MFLRSEYLTTMQNGLTGTNVVQLAQPLVFVDRISIILPILFSFADRIHDLISVPLSLFQSPPKEKAFSQSTSSESHLVIPQHRNCSMSREEVKLVMEKIEMSCSQDSELGEIGQRFGSEELSGMFDESEPSLEELKQTFNAFDRNRDGFIDGEELHRVLGLFESSDGIFIHDCNRMIARFDLNRDGKIDFNEFLKLMEIALS